MAQVTASLPDLEGFERLAHLVSIYRPTQPPSPSTAAVNSTSSDPQLVVLCTWMGAAPRHIAKYTAQYQTLFPSSAILLVSSSVRDTFGDLRAQRSRMLVACQAVTSFRPNNQDAQDKTAIDETIQPRVLLHCMSNGGGIAAMHLTGLLRGEFHWQGRLYSKVILDCMPGRDNVEKSVTAISMSLPQNVLVRLVARMLLRVLLYTTTFLRVVLLRREGLMDRLRRQLNDPAMIEKEVPRLYLYSRADRLIPHGEVHEHATSARERGVGYGEVREEVFETAAHCALMVNDSKRYWTCISEFWQQTVPSSVSTRREQ